MTKPMEYEKWLNQLPCFYSRNSITQFITRIPDVGIMSTDINVMFIVKNGFYDESKYPDEFNNSDFVNKKGVQNHNKPFFPESAMNFYLTEKHPESRKYQVAVIDAQKALKTCNDFEYGKDIYKTVKISSDWYGNCSERFFDKDDNYIGLSHKKYNNGYQYLKFESKFKNDLGENNVNVTCETNNDNHNLLIKNFTYHTPYLLNALKGFDNSAEYYGKGKKRKFLRHKTCTMIFFDDFVRLESDDKIAIIMGMQ